jgi:alkaline phosphatase
MKYFIAFVLLAVSATVAAQPVRIHSQNDYQKAEPQVNALRNKVYSVEADVYLVNDTLKVAHNKNELATAPTLFSEYLEPVIHLFQTHHNRMGNDSSYAPILMVDIKENSEASLRALVKMISAYPFVFDRRINKSAMQVVISGERGRNWTAWPALILFDGRPDENYDAATLERVVFVSDSYLHYADGSKNKTDSLIRHAAEKVHAMKKLFRLWAIPDNPASWDHLLQLGIDIINTDKVTECRNYFSRVLQ